MLKNFNNYYRLGDEDNRPAKERINTAKQYVSDQKKEIEKRNKILTLLEKDLIVTIKSCVSYFYIDFDNFSTFNNFSKWLKMRNDSSVDKRKKYEEKDTFDLVVHGLSKTLFDDNPIEIVNMMWHGLSSYGVDIEIRYHDILFSIFIPDLASLHVENFHESCEGKLAVSVVDGIVHHRLAASYEEKEIADIIRDYVAKRENENE